MDAWRTAVVEEAKTWLGTPWVHRARIKGAGVDCAQFLIGAYVGAGVIEAFDTGDYPPDWMMHREEERFLGWIDRYMIPTFAALPADVAIWKFGRCFSHAAIVIEWPVVIHSFRKERGVVWGNALLGDLSRHEMQLYTKRLTP
jgi:cell wall-associated NlpC family hydrolase